jgi:hypothetical protein
MQEIARRLRDDKPSINPWARNRRDDRLLKAERV